MVGAGGLNLFTLNNLKLGVLISIEIVHMWPLEILIPGKYCYYKPCGML